MADAGNATPGPASPPPAIDAFEALKAATVFIRSPDGSTGSGYVVAPGCIGTAWHVVDSWGEGETHEVMVGLGPARKTVRARRMPRADEQADAAVLAVEGELDVPPLPVAGALTRKATWDGYGFPGLAIKTPTPSGLPLSGHVQDPNTYTDEGHPAVLLYSEQIAAGQASPLHGFSGSPVVVDGALVGHLVKHIGDPDDNRRAAYGYVYACPIARVTALLDHPPAPRAIAPPALPPTPRECAAAVPLAADEYHVFVSYRSTDRPWAMALVARLEGAGLRVFFDQKELEPGQYLGEQLSAGLQRSRAAVVLVTPGWLESGWCRQEAAVLDKRAAEEPGFTLVPLRLDGAVRMPPLLDSRLWLDFAGVGQPEGPKLQLLLDVLLHRTGAGADTPQARAAAAQQAVTDRFVTQVHAAVKISAAEVDMVIAEWRKTASDDAAPLIVAAEGMIGKGWPRRALAFLAEAPASLRVRQLAALAKRKAQLMPEALQDLEALVHEGHHDAETLGLLAGTYKAMWQGSGDNGFRERAYRTHLEAYERFNDAFNGINAAALALYCGDEGRMHEIAGQLITSLKAQAGRLDAWGKASLGEAYLLKKRIDDARDWYAQAVADSAGRHQEIAVMRRQARRDLEALGQPRDLLDATLPVPRVLAYVGHRVDEDGRATPRFPEEKVRQVKQAIADKLKGLGAVHDFGGAASGTDLLVLKELASRGLTATVVLPFPEEDFIRESVGEHWRRQYDEVRARKGTIEFTAPLRDRMPARDELPRAFAASNEEVLRRALEYAKALDEEEPVVLVVWDGKKGDGPGGTADAVRLWRRDGCRPIVIDPTRL